jgi:hypothetical protein
MGSHLFSFGTTVCEVIVTPKPNMAGTGVPVQYGVPYVWEDDGCSLRELANRDGERIHYHSSSEDATVTFLAKYLEERFGEQGVPLREPVNVPEARPILQPPLVDDRQES